MGVGPLGHESCLLMVEDTKAMFDQINCTLSPFTGRTTFDRMGHNETRLINMLPYLQCIFIKT